MVGVAGGELTCTLLCSMSSRRGRTRRPPVLASEQSLTGRFRGTRPDISTHVGDIFTFAGLMALSFLSGVHDGRAKLAGLQSREPDMASSDAYCAMVGSTQVA